MMKISELARKCEYEFCGEDREIDSISYSFCAKENEIAIVNHSSEIYETKAMCILTEPAVIKTNKTLLFISDAIELAAVKVADILVGSSKDNKVLKYTKTDGYYCGENVRIGENTIISPNVYIGNNVDFGKNCFVEPNVYIGNGTTIKDNVYIGFGSSIGADSFYHYYEDGLKDFSGIGHVIIDANVKIGNHTTIQRGTFSDTYIGQCCKIGNLIDIGHDVQIGRDCKIVSQTGIASNVIIGNHVQIFGQVGVSNHVKIEDFATVMGKSLVTKDIPMGKAVSGIYAREHSEELRFQAKLRRMMGRK